MDCIFKNDNDCEIKLPTDFLLSNSQSQWRAMCDTFRGRDDHEVIFRKVHSYLIRNNIIKNNIIDTGCWLGDNSIPWAKQITGTVYAIDPSSDNIIFIDEICKINDINNVKTIQTAVSDKEEALYSETQTNHYEFNSAGVGQYKLNAVSLDHLHETKQIENISLIHLDVEGMEAKVVKGSEKIIETYRPIVSFEQHVEREPYMNIVNFFIQNDYEVYLINETSLPGCLPDCRNFIAFPRELKIDPNKICADTGCVALVRP
jgi:FkbM family methyltransferase